MEPSATIERIEWRAYLGRSFLVLVLCWTTGCGLREVLPLPRELPESLGPRRLWHTPRAYIYAQDETVAGETDRWIGGLAAHILRTYQARLGKGLVVVVDQGELPCVKTFDEVVRLRRMTASALGRPKDKLPVAADQRRKLTESGMSEELACGILAVSLDDDALARMGLSADLPADVAWRMCCPSQRLMQSAVWEFAPKVLERKKGKVFAVATAWAWPLAFPEVAKGFRLGRDVLAFELWSTSQAGWDPGQRATETSRYTKERAFLISPTLALALSLASAQEREARKATTRPAPE